MVQVSTPQAPGSHHSHPAELQIPAAAAMVGTHMTKLAAVWQQCQHPLLQQNAHTTAELDSLDQMRSIGVKNYMHVQYVFAEPIAQ